MDIEDKEIYEETSEKNKEPQRTQQQEETKSKKQDQDENKEKCWGPSGDIWASSMVSKSRSEHKKCKLTTK